MNNFMLTTQTAQVKLSLLWQKKYSDKNTVLVKFDSQEAEKHTGQIHTQEAENNEYLWSASFSLYSVLNHAIAHFRLSPPFKLQSR